MESKKIGLITLPLIDNYGGIIQLAALNSFLEGQGHKVFHLNKRFNVSPVKQYARKLFKWNPLYFIFDFKNHAKKYRYIKNLNDFIDIELQNSTKDIFSSKQLTEKVDELDLDAVIVGSDQVWRMLYINENYKDYFLGFVSSHNIKKISYAASFGTDTWETIDNIDSVKVLLNDFTAISVREDSGVLICKNTFEVKKDVCHVLDPTFLPDLSYYDAIIEREFNLKKKVELFNYVLDKSPKKLEIIKRIAQNLNLNIDAIYLENNLKDFSNNKNLKPSIGEWLYHFKNADFIITDSFHGTVFSIVFNKEFITIGNKSRGLSRFLSLLGALNLKKRFILEDSKNYLPIIKELIDYETVNKTINELKLDSISFLNKALK